MLVRERCWCLYENGLVTVSRQGDTSAADSRTFTFKGCETGSYTFRLLTAIGDSELARVTVRVNEAVTPKAPAPTGLRATVNSTSSIALSWNAVANAHRYRLERAATSSGPWTVVGDELATTTRAATGLACGTTYQFRVSARGDGAPYDSKWGAPSSSLAAGTPCVSASVASDDLFVGQSAALTATVTGAPGGASYRWQKWGNGAWTNLAATSTTHSVSSATTSVSFFRFAVNYPSGGGSAASGVLAVQWRPMSVSVSASPEFPLSASSTMRTVTLTATSTAPSGVSYQWQQGAGGGWTDLGAKTTSLTKDVSFTTRGTRKFRVVASHATASSATSSPVYVTWDEWAIVSEMMGKLSDAVATSTTYKAAQTALLKCMNGSTGGGGKDSATSTPGGATSTTPTYISFDDILARYATTTKAKMDGECSATSTAMFSANQSVTRAELAKLKAGNIVYAALLDTPHGRQFEANAGDSDELKFISYLGAATFEPGQFTVPLYATSSDDGASGTDGPDEEELPVVGTGVSCLPPGADGANLSLSNKLVVLNCLVFSTPHDFWVKGDKKGRSAKSLKNAIDSSIGRYAWLDRGDWECTLSPDGPLPSCLKHDVAYGGLQEFAGQDTKTSLTASPDGTELDEAWNPRNKALADAKFKADIAKWGCQDETSVAKAGVCALARFPLSNAFMAEHVYFWGTARMNSKGWPVTTRDLRHIDGLPRFIVCGEPVVPTVSEFTATRTEQIITASWNFVPGCVPVTLSDVKFTVDWIIMIGGSVYPYSGDASTCVANGNRLTCAYDFSYLSYLPQGKVISGVSIFVVPQDREYGGHHYGGEGKTGRKQTFSVGPWEF